MQRDPTAPLSEELAREIAVREGLKAIIAGEITAAGLSFVITSRLVSAQSGAVLAAYRETADSTTVIAAIDRLSRRLRERIGESLKTIRANEPLAQVTTQSLEALRKYSRAVRAIEVEGDVDKGRELLLEATALDSTFAMAHRKLGIVGGSRGAEAVAKAFEFRERLTDRERYMTVGTYHQFIGDEREKAVTAYRTLLDTYPDDFRALNNLALLYLDSRDFVQAEEILQRAVATDSFAAIVWSNLIESRVEQSKFDEAQAALAAMQERVPEHPLFELSSLTLASARRDYETAERVVNTLREERKESLFWQARTRESLADLAAVRGKLADAERLLRDIMADHLESRYGADYVGAAVELALVDVIIRGEPARGEHRLQEALDRYPLDSIAPEERLHFLQAAFFGYAGRADRARESDAEYQALIAPERRDEPDPWRYWGLGVAALNEGRFQQAIADLRVWNEGIEHDCVICALPDLGRAYELAGQPDSALAVYERYLSTPWSERLDWDSIFLAATYERLASLYEDRGEPDRAVYYYGKLVELWSEADPELQPRVEASRRAIGALSRDR
jgi:tetratricopeptide (TPR) repeat protein